MSSLRAFVHLDGALPLYPRIVIRRSSKGNVNLLSVLCHVNRVAVGEFHKLHHLLGLMHLRAIKVIAVEPSALMAYVAESVGYLDTLLGLLSWRLIILDEIMT